MFQHWLRSCLLLLILTSGIHAQTPASLVHSVNSLPGWTTTGEAATFNESSVEQFDAKLASILRIYEVEGVTVQAWQGPMGPVRATLFQLSDASAAYGFFTNRRRIEGTTASSYSAGTESFETRGTYYFWQSNYVVRIAGERASAATLSDTLSRNILGRSQRPAVAGRLPTSNLISGSEEYILAASSIEKAEGIDPSELGFDSSAEAASASYRINGKTARLLLLIYPTQQLAKKYADQLNTKDPRFAGSRKRIGPLLAIVHGTSDASAIQSLLDQVHYSSKVTWNEPQPGLGLGPIIVTVFTFIGLLLAACVFVGFGLGGARVVMKFFFPNRVFDRQDDVEFIQLKLDQELTRKELGE
jgi:hypothetical protein